MSMRVTPQQIHFNAVNPEKSLKASQTAVKAPRQLMTQGNFIKSRDMKNVSMLGGAARNAADTLGAMNRRGIYKNLKTESSDPSSVELKFTGVPPEKECSFSLTVDELAAAQKNEGERLVKSSEYAGGTGRQTFGVEIDGEKHYFEVDVKKGETNKEVMQKITDAVNKGGIGITARISDKGGAAVLELEAENTGERPAGEFTVSDVTGTLAAETGISNVAVKARDAVYTVDGRKHTSHINDISLATGVDVTLKNISKNAVEISVKNDPQAAADATRSFLDAFNDLLTAAEENTNGDPWLSQFLNEFINSFSDALEQAGITKGADGRLAITDSLKFSDAYKNGELEKLFAQINDRLGQTIGKVADNPSAFMDNAPKDASGDARPTGAEAPAEDNKLFNIFS